MDQHRLAPDTQEADPRFTPLLFDNPPFMGGFTFRVVLGFIKKKKSGVSLTHPGQKHMLLPTSKIVRAAHKAAQVEWNATCWSYNDWDANFRNTQSFRAYKQEALDCLADGVWDKLYPMIKARSAKSSADKACARHQVSVRVKEEEKANALKRATDLNKFAKKRKMTQADVTAMVQRQWKAATQKSEEKGCKSFSGQEKKAFQERLPNILTGHGDDVSPKNLAPWAGEQRETTETREVRVESLLLLITALAVLEEKLRVKVTLGVSSQMRVVACTSTGIFGFAARIVPTDVRVSIIGFAKKGLNLIFTTPDEGKMCNTLPPKYGGFKADFQVAQAKAIENGQKQNSTNRMCLVVHEESLLTVEVTVGTTTWEIGRASCRERV